MKDIDSLDQILFDCVVAVGKREKGTVMDLDTLIIDRPKAIAALLKWRDKAVVTELNYILANASGGGSWRRVIISRIEHYKGAE